MPMKQWFEKSGVKVDKCQYRISIGHILRTQQRKSVATMIANFLARSYSFVVVVDLSPMAFKDDLTVINMDTYLGKNVCVYVLRSAFLVPSKYVGTIWVKSNSAKPEQKKPSRVQNYCYVLYT